MTIKFRSAMDISNDILKGMELSKQAMIEEGLWNDQTTLEEWSHYAGSHILITEKQPEKTWEEIWNDLREPK